MRWPPRNGEENHKIVLDKRQMKVPELTGVLSISENAVNRILTETFDLRKLCARWVLRLPTTELTQFRGDVLIESLTMFRHNKAEILHQFITVDEKCACNFTPATQHDQNNELERKNRLQRGEYFSIIVASVSWNARGIIFMDCFQRGKTINGEYYAKLL